MIELSNGHKFEYMAASGALAFNGKGWFWEWPLRKLGLLNPSLFTVVAKTVTYYSRKGNLRWWNPFRCVRPLIKGGVVSAVGLTNPGYSRWWIKFGRIADSKKIPLVASLFSDAQDAPHELAYMACNFEAHNRAGLFDLVALEINASCPNAPGDILKNTEKIIKSCQEVKKVSSFPLILKLSVVHDINVILPEIKGVIEAISINSVPWRIVFPNKKSPLAHFGGGGVSGKIVQPYTWKFVEKLVQKTSIPVIGPSVWDFEDIEKLRKIGAKAISFGSIFFRYPWRPTLYVKKDMKRNQI